LRVIVDTARLRRTRAGTARWVSGLVGALDDLPGLEVVRATGPRRLGSGPLFRPINVTLERLWYQRGMRRAAERCGADVILMPSAYACPRGRIPQLVTILDVNYLTQPGTYDPLFVRYAKWVTRRTARDADCLMTISEFSRSEISKHLRVDPERISVVYPGLDRPPEGVFPRPLDRPYALYVGATEKHKNIGILLDAWRQMAGDLALAIVGRPGRDHADLAARAAKSGGRVLLIGSVDDHELEAWYRGASAFLFPSLAEGFGYPPLEAMQRCVPVIASRAGSLPEVLGDAALYFDPTDASELAGRISQVIADDGLRADMVAKGLRQAGKFNWPDTAASTLSLLDGLANRD
jgi:glycosyltransferase involved in cell wall biosynthesis